MGRLMETFIEIFEQDQEGQGSACSLRDCYYSLPLFISLPLSILLGKVHSDMDYHDDIN